MTGERFRRGDIWTVHLEPVVGSEQGKTRPALVIQNDIGNQYSPVLIVAALTSGENARYDVQVEVKAPEGGLQRNSLVLLNQVRTIDKRRVGRYWGRLSTQTMQRVDEAIKISLGLVPI
ncbi:MAG: type II toxin-antitoxin system PemK/MazF family toxin [Chloroflexota bacterium]|nr:type II toxin-antitoxin system PemK/MazF family toxin [Chloroflexota bacterium]